LKNKIITIEGFPKDLKKQLCKKLKNKVFHITTEDGFEVIQRSGEILCSNHSSIKNTNWGSKESPSYFRKRNCISVCDFYNNTNIKELITASRKYTWYDPNSVVHHNISYILVLNEFLYKDLITWKNWKKEKVFGEQIVPHLESGIKDKILMSNIDVIIKVVSFEESRRLMIQRYKGYLNKGEIK
jgi:hypothetical protein